MNIVVREISVLGRTTLSSLFIDGVWECFVLEDIPRHKKVWGETRISGGKYEIVKRFAGRHYRRYSKSMGHEFSLYIPNVPNFTWIMIHIGNEHVDTAGCLLVGTGVESRDGNFKLQNSKNAYENLYEKIKTVIDKDRVYIEIIRIDESYDSHINLEHNQHYS